MSDNEFSLPLDLSQFVSFSLDPLLNETRERNIALLDLQYRDYKWRIDNRSRYGLGLVVLLVMQNIAVFTLAFMAYQTGHLEKLQAVLSILITGTLASTAYSINLIIKWLFSDIDYRLYK